MLKSQRTTTIPKMAGIGCKAQHKLTWIDVNFALVSQKQFAESTRISSIRQPNVLPARSSYAVSWKFTLQNGIPEPKPLSFSNFPNAKT